MKLGDVLKIKGWFGFLKDPTMIVLDIKEDMVKLIRQGDDGTGLLGNDTMWCGIDLIKKRLK